MVKEEHGTWFTDGLLEWFATYKRDFPWRSPDTTPYQIFVAELMHRKTRSENVLPVYNRFLEVFPTVVKLSRAEIPQLEEVLRPLGLYHQRAQDFLHSAVLIMAVHKGKIPTKEDYLLHLPGVGEYTARAILSFAFAKGTTIVDVNVERILVRLFGIRKKTCEKTLERIQNTLATSEIKYFHRALLDFGALVCTARSPKCSTCPFGTSCLFHTQS